jgi:phosphoribosylformylglycinamidine synthase subunit PurSL
MLWEVEIQPKREDRERDRLGEEYALFTHRSPHELGILHTTHGFLLEGKLTEDQARLLVAELLVDPLVETGNLRALERRSSESTPDRSVRTVLLKPGVMDPVSLSVVDAGRDLNISLDSVRTFRRYYFDPARANGNVAVIAKILANDAIEQVATGPLALEHLSLGGSYSFRLGIFRLGELDSAGLEKVSREGGLALNLTEMRAIQEHFKALGREPTDVELETIAQTWSEHCSHKTLKGQIDFDGCHFQNLLKETIFAATRQIRERLGEKDWCVSVFEDNAGIVRFSDQYHVCFKVETHNHPSAIEPYGGANTGLGGVIRDPLGTGLGGTPICNTDVFCFAPPDTPPESLPPGVLHPKKTMKGVVAGVRDYGNRIGIPTVNGAVCFDPRYLANPLVFCGTVGLIPANRAQKQPMPGDHIVVVGGRTGRDGIHGATFSSLELTAESEEVSGGAVQIGNAITEKKMLDVIVEARDRGLYHAITDCGAGGLSSAVGEMAAKLGAEVQLDCVPLKYAGLSYTEIWISESQERMVLAVPSETWPALQALCAGEGVEATVIGAFVATGCLRLFYEKNRVADLDLHFLHEGRPGIVRLARMPERPTPSADRPATVTRGAPANFTEDLLKILSAYNVCSKEWIIRQYDHEVRGGTVIKPLVGVRSDGPGDAAVIVPVLGEQAGLAIGCGINPHYGELDPYRMAAAAVDEAVRNVVAVGADPERIALLDNFCWGNTDRPEVLGSLVRAAEACRDTALAYGTPFISGKDSLNNEYRSGDWHIAIPPTLLISALGRVPDVRRSVTMDLKEPGNMLFLVGATRNEMGGSHYHLVNHFEGGEVPEVEFPVAPRLFRGLHAAMKRGLVRACHDLSEGGLAVAVAEMAFAGGIGADLTDIGSIAASEPDEVLLFSESPSRFVVEVRPADASAFRDCFENKLPVFSIGKTCAGPRLRIAGREGEWLVWAGLTDLREAWQKPLRW